jgi:hypothetical protein
MAVTIIETEEALSSLHTVYVSEILCGSRFLKNIPVLCRY